MSRLEEIIRKYQTGAEGAPLSRLLVEDLLRQSRYTGPVVTHWRNGVPCTIEAGKPVTVDIVEKGS